MTTIVLLVLICLCCGCVIFSLAKPIAFGLEDISRFADDIDEKNFSVSDFSDSEVETLFYDLDRLGAFGLYNAGLILYENKDISFREEYCIFTPEGNSCPEVFMCFEHCFMVMPYTRILHNALAKNYFARGFSEELFCDDNLDFLKNIDEVIDNLKDDNPAVYNRFDLLKEIQELLLPCDWVIESSENVHSEKTNF